MSTTQVTLLFVLIYVLWNVGTVIYFIRTNRAKKLSAIKYVLVLTIGLGLTVSLILFAVITASQGFRFEALGFALLVFSIHAIVGLPLYFLTKKYIIPRLQK